MFRIRSFAARAALRLGGSLETEVLIMGVGGDGEFGEVSIVSVTSSGESLETRSKACLQIGLLHDRASPFYHSVI
jgi:hypothetical protein